MNHSRLVLIGGGQMGRALVGGMISVGMFSQENVTVVDPNPECLAWWRENFPDTKPASEPNQQICEAADVLLLAVKPHLTRGVTAQAASLTQSPRLIVSVAAGILLGELAAAAGHDRVVRVMPNTPSLVGAGASGYCVGETVSEEDCQWVESALSGVGIAVKVTERQLDAVTGLSGSGPAYLCVVIEALADGGVLAGLPRQMAMKLASQTVLGTAKLVQQTGRHPGELKDAVASPGGTTIPALHELEKGRLRATLINAVQVAAERSREMSSE
ncbi:MAG: pyrroline-5-carboxylate reductase [Planctomycetota bacterium]